MDHSEIPQTSGTGTSHPCLRAPSIVLTADILQLTDRLISYTRSYITPIPACMYTLTTADVSILTRSFTISRQTRSTTFSHSCAQTKPSPEITCANGSTDISHGSRH